MVIRNFYDIGLPIPLEPTPQNYDLNLFCQAFKLVNSFLYKSHVGSLTKDALTSSHQVLRAEGLEAAEEYIISLAEERAERSQQAAIKRGERKNAVTRSDLMSSLYKYNKRKEQLVVNLRLLTEKNDEAKEEIVHSTTRESKRLTSLLLSFFRNFDTTTRPLVMARVSNSRYRILGRSLVNKKEKNGLELKEVSKNSPLKAIFEGGLALYQTIGQGQRARELHEIENRTKFEELETAKINKEIALEKLKGEKLSNALAEIKIAKELQSIIHGADINSVQIMPNSFIKTRINKAYQIEQNNASRMINTQGLTLDRSATKIIDATA